jgi:hypothetical protein
MISGCFLRLERAPPLPKYTAPYGAHFVKLEMTKAERLQDVISCGSANGLTPRFSKAERENAEMMTEEFEIGKNNDGYYILLRRLDRCMKSKGYYKIPMGYCESNRELCMD